MPDDIKLPDIMLMVRALEHTQKPARPIALEMIERGIEAYARAAAEAERANITEDMKSAVRWAPSSAHWSERLREFFGPDAREGITALERQLREARAAVEADRAQQAAEIERLRTDAERYRWLRSLEWFAEAEIGIELDGSAWRIVFSSPAPFENASGGSWLDAAIEAAHGIPAPKGGSEP